MKRTCGIILKGQTSRTNCVHTDRACQFNWWCTWAKIVNLVWFIVFLGSGCYFSRPLSFFVMVVVPVQAVPWNLLRHRQQIMSPCPQKGQSRQRPHADFIYVAGTISGLYVLPNTVPVLFCICCLLCLRNEHPFTFRCLLKFSESAFLCYENLLMNLWLYVWKKRHFNVCGNTFLNVKLNIIR